MKYHTPTHTIAFADRARRDNQGVALVVVLIFMVILTSISVYAARNSTLSERMARNQLDIEGARQAAEAALRDAEYDLLLANGTARTNVNRTGTICARGGTRPLGLKSISQFKAECLKGQCEAVALDTVSYAANSTVGEAWWSASKNGLWEDNANLASANCDTFEGGVPYGTFTARAELPGVRRQPEYLVEYVKSASESLLIFRITARGFGRNPTTEVVLQSYFTIYK